MSTELESSVELQRLLLLMSDSDMAVAAQQLMQLSDEDSSSDGNNNNKKKKKSKAQMMESEECFRQSECSALFEEIFGKEEISRPTKKRKYRFLESIYKETTPVKASYGLEQNPNGFISLYKYY